MKFPVIMTEGHQGKVLEMDADQEGITLHSAAGKLLGVLSWGVVIEQILASDEETRFTHARRMTSGRRNRPTPCPPGTDRPPGSSGPASRHPRAR